MRVAIVTEAFLPVINGVINSVVQVVAHLVRGGHQALVVRARSGRCGQGARHLGRVAGAGAA
ncbi:MAG: hypothetical protein ACRDTA_24065 [Pseudonocardiaceae bacterium]